MSYQQSATQVSSDYEMCVEGQAIQPQHEATLVTDPDGNEISVRLNEQVTLHETINSQPVSDLFSNAQHGPISNMSHITNTIAGSPPQQGTHEPRSNILTLIPNALVTSLTTPAISYHLCSMPNVGKPRECRTGSLNASGPETVTTYISDHQHRFAHFIPKCAVHIRPAVPSPRPHQCNFISSYKKKRKHPTASDGVSNKRGFHSQLGEPTRQHVSHARYD